MTFYVKNDNDDILIDDNTLFVPSLAMSQTSTTFANWPSWDARLFDSNGQLVLVPMYRYYTFWFTLPDTANVSEYRLALSCSDGMRISTNSYAIGYNKGDRYLTTYLFYDGPDYETPPRTTNQVMCIVSTNLHDAYTPSSGTVTAHLFHLKPSINSTGYGIKVLDQNSREIFGSSYKPFKAGAVISHTPGAYNLENLFSLGSYTAPSGYTPLVFCDLMGLYGYQNSFGWTSVAEDHFGVGFSRSGNVLTLKRGFISRPNAVSSTSDFSVPVPGIKGLPSDSSHYVYYSGGTTSYQFFLGTSVL